MTHNLFDNAKFGDMFLTTENKQAVFLRFAENAEYEFAILYVEDWGNVQVFRHNGKAIYNDAAHSIISKKEEPVSEDLEEASLRASIIRGQHIPKEYLDEYPYDAYAQSMFKRGANWQKEQMMAEAIDVEVKVDAGGYPYIDKTIELYDYDKDVPLAKEGDRVKVIVIKED